MSAREMIQCVWNVTTGKPEMLRTPNTIKWVGATTSAATDIWAPAAGKKFRVMKVVISPDAGLAAAGIQKISLIEETLGDIGLNVQTYLPIAASIVHQVPIVLDLPGNGYLSTTAGKKLQVTLTSACTAGLISITVFGTEE